MKRVTLADFLTDAEIARAMAILAETRGDYSLHAKLRDELIAPNTARINAALGQESDADYLAYAVEFVLESATRTTPHRRH